jgi:imidazolonepropionase-like amidohydrolase
MLPRRLPDRPVRSILAPQNGETLMKKIITAILLLSFCSLPQRELFPQPADLIALKAPTLYSIAPQFRIENGVVLIRNGKIEEIGTAKNVSIPRDTKVYEFKKGVVTPGLIDAHSQLGLSGIWNVPADQDVEELTGPTQPELRAIDGINPTEELLSYVKFHGVTLTLTGPGSGNVIGGQAALIRTHGTTLDEILVKAPAGVQFSLGELPKRFYAEKQQKPTTRMATAALIRQAFIEAQAYQEEWERYRRQQGAAASQPGDKEKADKEPPRPPKREVGKEALLQVLKKEIPALVHCARADDIATALRLKQEFGFNLILDQATEAWLIADAIKQANVPVLVGPVMQRVGEGEQLNANLENAARLQKSGILFAFMTGAEGYVPKTRVLPFEAAIGLANGLPFEDTLKAVSLNPARILGIEADYGSLEKGKAADLVVFDGDPFEYFTRVKLVLIKGEVVHESR